MRALLDSHELLRNLTMRDVRGKYRRTALGQGWSLLNPIAQIALYSLVFSYILRVPAGRGTESGLDVFALWLASALLPWLFFASVVGTGLGALVGNANLIKKVYFPREALIISVAFSCLFTFLIELCVLHIAVLVFGGTVRIELLLATVLLTLLLSVFATGVALFFAVANVYFRDTQYLVSLLLMAWFYLTPIIYPISLISARVGTDSAIFTIYQLNPLARFAEAFRDTIYNGQLPGLWTTSYLLLASAATLVLGHAVFRRLEGRLAEEL